MIQNSQYAVLFWLLTTYSYCPQYISNFTHLVTKFVRTSKLQLFLPRNADKFFLFCTLASRVKL